MKSFNIAKMSTIRFSVDCAENLTFFSNDCNLSLASKPVTFFRWSERLTHLIYLNVRKIRQIHEPTHHTTCYPKRSRQRGRFWVRFHFGKSSQSWPRESYLTSVRKSKHVCRHPMSSHILNSLVFLGRDLIKLFSLSYKNYFREGVIFFTAMAWRWMTQ
jgi:hypothetical protein